MTAAKKSPAKSYAAMIHIGAEAGSIKEIRSAINEILKTPFVDEKTKRLALDTLRHATSVNNTSISNSTFTG